MGNNADDGVEGESRQESLEVLAENVAAVIAADDDDHHDCDVEAPEYGENGRDELDQQRVRGWAYDMPAQRRGLSR